MKEQEPNRPDRQAPAFLESLSRVCEDPLGKAGRKELQVMGYNSHSTQTERGAANLGLGDTVRANLRVSNPALVGFWKTSVFLCGDTNDGLRPIFNWSQGTIL